MATGWDPYDAGRIDNLGFGTHPDVITNVMMERLAAANGPTKGQIVRPSDGRPVQSAVFVQCAGSRDQNHLGYCSGICCLASLKEATYLRERNPDSRAHVFYIDLRTPGTYEFFQKKVLGDERITITKGKVARVSLDQTTGKLAVEAEDILAAGKTRLPVDLVVLASGMVPSLARGGLDGPVALDADRFVLEAGRRGRDLRRGLRQGARSTSRRRCRTPPRRRRWRSRRSRRRREDERVERHRAPPSPQPSPSEREREPVSGLVSC